MTAGIKRSKSDVIFDRINVLIMIVIMFVMIYPMYFVLIASISDPTAVSTGQVILYPVGYTLDAYRNVFVNSRIWVGYANTILYTVLGTLYNLVLTISCAYVLSKKDLPFHNLLSWYFFITMYFGGGMIPTYLLIKDLHLIDTRWVMIIGAGVSCYNMIVTRSFFTNSIPDSLYEAAYIDGASEIRTFIKIALPLSTPIIAVMALYYGVGHWNSYTNALYYLRDKDLWPLQMILRQILILNQETLQILINSGDATQDQLEAAVQAAHLAEAMKYALVFVAAAPLLCVYPFVQKYFVKGVMIGSVKG